MPGSGHDPTCHSPSATSRPLCKARDIVSTFSSQGLPRVVITLLASALDHLPGGGRDTSLETLRHSEPKDLPEVTQQTGLQGCQTPRGQQALLVRWVSHPCGLPTWGRRALRCGACLCAAGSFSVSRLDPPEARGIFSPSCDNRSVSRCCRMAPVGKNFPS